MIRKLAPWRAGCLAVAAVAACGACGGGGSSGGGSPPPPPVSSPPPPPPGVTAVATVNAATVDEGQDFRLDASASTGVAGTTLTYAWTQTAGPIIAIASPTSAALTLNAPEVTANTTATFSVNVTGGASSAQASVNVTFSNIAQTPVHATLPLRTTVVFPFPVTNLLAAYNDAIIGQSLPQAGGNTAFVSATASAGGDITINGGVFAGNYAPATTVFSVAPFGLGTEPFGLKYSVMREDLSVNPWLLFRTPLPGSSMFFSQIEKPCGIHWTHVDGATGAYVGQRAKGFTIFKLNDLGSNQIFLSTLTSVAAGKSFCVLSAPRQPIRGGFSFDGPNRSLQDVIAIDAETNTIFHYTQTSPASFSYTLKETVPIQLDAAAPLKLVAHAEVGPLSEGLALAFTDGQHRGTHRLVILGFDAQRNIVQETHSWQVGVPSTVLHENLDRDNFLEIAVVTSTSPQAVVFESIPPALGATAQYLPLSDARYVEIGLGATSAVSSLKRIFGFDALYVGYRDQKQVRVLTTP